MLEKLQTALDALSFEDQPDLDACAEGRNALREVIASFTQSAVTGTQYVGNAFSLGMIPRDLLGQVRFTPCEEPDVSGLVSCVGHTDTAAVLGVEMRRVSVTLQPGDVLHVAQLSGGRLPEGCTTLPDGFRFEWVRVDVGVQS